MGNITYNGVSSKELGLVVQASPSQDFPERDVSITHVPGRNGDVIIDNNSYKNVTRTYNIASAFREGTSFASNAQAILQWLQSSSGYARLEDTYDPDVYRMAMFHASGSFTNYYEKATAISISFECKPQRYLKVGEEEQVFSSSDFYIENPTIYTSLPTITISGLPKAGEDTTDLTDVVMMTVYEVHGENESVTSSITFNRVDDLDIIIDSEKQRAYNEEEELNDKIGLNGKKFPMFAKDLTHISFETFSEKKGARVSYKSLIEKQQLACRSEYISNAKLIDYKQHKFLVRSFQSLIGSKTVSYTSESYMSFALDKANTYEMPSFNELIRPFGHVADIKGTFSEINSDQCPAELFFNPRNTAETIHPDDPLTPGKSSLSGNPYTWFNAIKKTEDTYNIVAQVTGFYMSNKVKKLVYYKKGSIVLSGIKNDESITLTMYQCDLDDKLNITSDIAYSGKHDNTFPEYISLNIEYGNNDGDPDGRKWVKKISYIVNADGYFYIKASSILEKDKWALKKINDVLNTASWDSLKGTFTGGTSLLSKSPTYKYTFYYISENDTKVNGALQYPNIIKKDETTGKVTIETECLFKVEASAGSNLTKFKLYGNARGYFRMYPSDASDSEVNSAKWNYVSKDDILPKALQNYSSVDAKKEFIVDYLPDTPTYADPEGTEESKKTWPIWLNPVAKNASNENITLQNLPTNYINFVVTKRGWYCYSVMTKNSSGEQEESFSEWKFMNENELLLLSRYNDPSTVTGRESDQSVTICWYDKDANSNPSEETFGNHHFRGYFLSQNGSIANDAQPVSYDTMASKDFAYFDEEFTEATDDDPGKVVYKANRQGFYKWDDNTKWVYYDGTETGDSATLLETSYTDSVTIYYLKKRPTYEIDKEVSEQMYNELFNNFDIVPDTVESEQEWANPDTDLNLVVKIDGYYKCNNETNWVYYHNGDIMHKSLYSELNTIYYLEKSNADLSNIVVTIVPRWWML